jgi:translation initiation factor IF-1
MSKEQGVRAEVIEQLPSNLYRVQLEDGKTVMAYLAGKMKYNRVRLIVGDKVEVVLDKWGGKTTNRITWRY